jgi:hypothetical protein
MNSALDWAWLGRKALLPEGFWLAAAPRATGLHCTRLRVVPVSEPDFRACSFAASIGGAACASALSLRQMFEANGERDNQ